MKLLFFSLFLAALTDALPQFSLSKGYISRHPALGRRGALSSAWHQARDLIPSDLSINTQLGEAAGYYLNISVGTPPQLQTVLLTTGASDLVIDSSSASQCTSAEDGCFGGTFDSTTSSSYVTLHPFPSFNISYTDGTAFVGEYGQDVIGVGDISISGIQFGLASDINSPLGPPTGILGLGYTANEAVSSTSDYYASFLDVLVESGAINSRLYSVYLGDDANGTGSVLFGGLDTTKFNPPLATFNFLPSPNTTDDALIYQFITTITAASITGNNGTTSLLWSGGSSDVGAFRSNSTSVPVSISMGTSAFLLPTAQFQKYIQPLFPYVDSDGYLRCNETGTGVSLSLTFAQSNTILVDSSKFIIPLFNSTTGSPQQYDDGTDACFFLIRPTEDSIGSIGESILRSMYVVYDLDNKQASFAQAVSDGGKEPNIVEVQAGPNGVANVATIIAAPSNTYALVPASYSDTVSHTVSTLATPIGAPAVVTMPSSTSTGGPTVIPKPGKSGSNTGAIAGGVVGGVAGLLAILAAVWYVLRRRKPKQPHPEVEIAGAAESGYPQEKKEEPPPVSPLPQDDHKPAKLGMEGHYSPVAESQEPIELYGGPVGASANLTEMPGSEARVELDGSWRGWEAEGDSRSPQSLTQSPQSPTQHENAPHT